MGSFTFFSPSLRAQQTPHVLSRAPSGRTGAGRAPLPPPTNDTILTATQVQAPQTTPLLSPVGLAAATNFLAQVGIPAAGALLPQAAEGTTLPQAAAGAVPTHAHNLVAHNFAAVQFPNLGQAAAAPAPTAAPAPAAAAPAPAGSPPPTLYRLLGCRSRLFSRWAHSSDYSSRRPRPGCLLELRSCRSPS